ncbi:MAG: hypothetical protein IJ341_02225 [Bacteroidales bacterium]|nr:hypothetical protein [Bacteroidales bacterium]
MNQNVRLQLTCPNCGNSIWIKREDEFECSACGEISNPEDMCCEAVPDLRHIISSNKIVMIFAENNSKNFTDEYDGNAYVSFYTFDSPPAFMSTWENKVKKPDSMWCWVYYNGECICSGACDPGDNEIFRMWFGGFTENVD